jgi:hypothetical protein
MNDSWYDLGELAQLVSRLGTRGAAITLTPVLRETSSFFGGLETPRTVLIIDRWEIRYAYDGDTEQIVAGPTLREAVHGALEDLNRRADTEASERPS